LGTGTEIKESDGESMSDFLIAQKKFYIVQKPQIITRHAKKEELINEGQCKKCGKYYRWKVQRLSQYESPDTDSQDRATRAMALFKEYNVNSESRLSGIGHCCAEREHRIFIKDNTGMVIYE